jgi:hypothetical protein
MTKEERLAELDDITRRANEILTKPHYYMHDGKPVTHPVTGEPVEDPWPVLNAIATLTRVCELRARILGLDSDGRGEITE